MERKKETRVIYLFGVYYYHLQVYIKATGEKSAEMVTDQGAIYITSNRGYNWRAAVQETVSATLNRFISFFFNLLL